MIARVQARVLAWCVAALLSAPATAWACPVCFSAKNDASREAFIWTTGFLTLLPLALLGAGIYVFVRRARALDEQHDAAREADAAAAANRASDATAPIRAR